MANVFLAVAQGPVGVTKLVVLKALLPELASEPSALAMFLDEARLAAQLNHPNVVQTYEVGTEGDRHVLVMEYLEGQSFAQIVNRAASTGNRLPTYLHLQVIISALDGLHYAHELCGYDGAPLNLVHRDVSPQNIFVTYRGEVKVLDFGIAKAASSSYQTTTGTIKGKIAYMAPEQMTGTDVDRRADLYSIGCMLWAVAAGKKLWKQASDVNIMHNVIAGELPDPQTVNPACDNELRRIVLKALAPNRDLRYQTAAELQEELEDYCEHSSLNLKRKELADYVSSLFSDTRRQMKALVEQELKSATSEDADLYSDLPAAEVHTLSEARLIQGSGTSASPFRDVSASGPHPRVTQTQGIWSIASGLHRKWLGWGVAIVALFMSLLVWALSSALSQDPPSVQAERKATQAAPTPKLVTIQIEATPSDARLFLDNVDLPSNPTSKVLTADSSVHRLRVEAPGHATIVKEFSASKDNSIRVHLTKIETKPKSLAAAADTAGSSGQQPPAKPSQAVQTTAKTTTRPPQRNVKRTTRKQAPNCQQPFYVDTDGIKKVRPECL